MYILSYIHTYLHTYICTAKLCLIMSRSIFRINCSLSKMFRARQITINLILILILKGHFLSIKFGFSQLTPRLQAGKNFNPMYSDIFKARISTARKAG